MKLGESGEAFFVQELHEQDLQDEEFDEHLATSPLLGNSPQVDSAETSDVIRKGLDANRVTEEAQAMDKAAACLDDPKKRRRRRKRRNQNGG